MKRLQKALLTALFMLAAAGCGDLTPDEAPPVLGDDPGDVNQEASANGGRALFKHETFGGNGRTCETCHSEATGTLSPAQAEALWAADPKNVLFRAIDSDDGAGNGYSQLRTHATVTVEIPLPDNISLAADPTARTITLRRGIPSTLDTPALDPVLMWDGREPTLQSQARSAIMGHAQATREPTQDELDSIALFEKTLFSSDAVRQHAEQGAPLPLPAGTTESEIRGRAFFEPTGLCGSCHSGPLLNEMTEFNPIGVPAGSRFGSTLVSEINLMGNPVHEFLVQTPDGTVSVSSPDPGLMLVTGNPAHAHVFKMTSLRNIKNTAPYFHDNSAKTLEDMMFQYKLVAGALGIPVTDQDIADIIAYIKLL